MHRISTVTQPKYNNQALSNVVCKCLNAKLRIICRRGRALNQVQLLPIQVRPKSTCLSPVIPTSTSKKKVLYRRVLLEKRSILKETDQRIALNNSEFHHESLLSLEKARESRYIIENPYIVHGTVAVTRNSYLPNH